MSGRNLLIFLVAFLLMLAGGVGGAAAQERHEVHDVGTAAIRGRILGANKEGPLARAEVYLHGSGTRVVLTDDEGRYAFANLPAGRYTLTTGRAGYVSIGVKDAIELADGQSRQQADIVLSHGGAIEATVVNESGEPMPGITVFALRERPEAGTALEAVFPEDRPDPGQSAFTTDDRGFVRLYDLPPGPWYLVASPLSSEVFEAGVRLIETRNADYAIALTQEATTVTAGGEVSVQIVMTTPVSKPTPPVVMPKPSVPAVDPRARGRISGRVLAADGSVPLRSARVLLEPAPSEFGRAREAFTDDEGRFEFVHVTDGDYRLTAGARGYLTRGYGQRAHARPMHSVQVANGAAVEHVDLTLIAAGSITVRITDDRGLPHAGVQVTLLERWHWADGYHLVKATSAVSEPIPNSLLTDDRGEVRLRELPAGDYWLSASFPEHETTLMEPPDAAHAQPLTCATTYFPGVIAPDLAQPIALDTGEQRTLGFSLMPARTARLSGRVIDNQGKSAHGSLIALKMRKEASYEDWDRAELSDGRFTFSQVPPGDYQLEYPDERQREDSDQFASLPLVVDGTDQAGLIVATTPPGTLRGRITFDTGGFPDDVTPESFSAAAGSVELPHIATLEIKPDWTFIADGIRSPALIYIDGSRGTWHLRRVWLDGVDVTNTPLREADNLEIVMTRGSNVGGTVVDSHNRPLFNCLVFIFSAAGVDPTEFRRNEYVNTADRGRFDIESLAPGRYFALPLPAGMPEGPMTSEAFARLESQATAFTVPEAEPRTVWLPLTINDQP